jgi:glycosyltransferase involved in cell wall biosynthesis
MRILIISLWSLSNTSIGGTEKFVIDLAKLLASQNSVTILSVGCVNLKIKKVKNISLNLVNDLNEYTLDKYLKSNGLENLKLKLNYILQKNKFDITHCNSLLFAGLLKNIPVVHTVHTNKNEITQSFSKHIINKITHNLKNDTRAYYATPSLHAQKSFKEFSGKKSILINHAFTSPIKLGNKKKLRRKYGILKEEIVFCIPSRLEIKQKGQELFLKALKFVKNILPPFVVLLSGCDKQYLKNKKYLLKKYKDFRIIITNFKNKNSLYSLSDVIVLPSKTESFGYSALESALAGLPLFLSNIPPYQEFKKNNKNIFLFKTNPQNIAIVLKENIKIIVKHTKINPSKKWRAKYGKKVMLHKYTNLYNKCISNF